MMAGNTLQGAAVLPPMSAAPVAEMNTTDADRKLVNPRSKTTKRSSPKEVGNRWQMLNEFIDVTLRDLRPAEAKVWMVLFRDSRNGISKVAQTHIAERCGITRESVSRAIKELEQRELVRTVRHGGVNRGLSWYQLRSKTNTSKACNTGVTLACDVSVKSR